LSFMWDLQLRDLHRVRAFHLWIVWGLYLGVPRAPHFSPSLREVGLDGVARATPHESCGWSNASALHKFNHQQPVIPSEAEGPRV
jgi:hypothetical protein